ncbi:MAG: redoxin domain-containing protein [Crocinitomix sp.]|nr:redoxin domain-containing protein [Crocinitomix sp.]
MNKLLTLFLLPLVICVNCSENELVINDAKIVVVFDDNRTEVVELLNSSRDVLKSRELEKQEKFIHYIYNEEGYYDLTFGDDKQRIFLKPGFNLQVSVDSANVLSYTGKGAIENQFLIRKAETYQSFGDLFYGMDYYKRDEDSFLHLVDSLQGIMDQLLAENSAEIDSNFFFYESKSAEFEKLNKIGNYELFHGFVLGMQGFQVSTDFPNPFLSIDFKDNRQLKAENYISYADTYFRTEASKDEETDFILTYVSRVKKEVESAEIAEALAYKIGADNLNYTDELDVVYDILKELISDPDNMADVDAKYFKLKKVEKGNPSPDFAMKNAEGNIVSLADFHGRLVYIDLWATWCKPCIAEMPHLKLTEEYFHGKNVAFVSICTRDTETEWRNFLDD